MQYSQAELVAVIAQTVKELAAQKVEAANASIAAWYPISDKKQAKVRALFLSQANQSLAKWVKYL